MKKNTAIALAALAFVGCGGGGGEDITEEPDRLIQWVGADDGILVQDLNGDGQIQQNEFFGSRMMTGRDIDNGFEDLALLDGNGNGHIDPASDEEAATFRHQDGLAASIRALRVWKDSNGNAKVDAGELLTLAEAGVNTIHLGYRDYEHETIKQMEYRQVPELVLGFTGCAWLKSERVVPKWEPYGWKGWAITIVDLDGDGIEMRTVPFGTGYAVKNLWDPAPVTPSLGEE